MCIPGLALPAQDAHPAGGEAERDPAGEAIDVRHDVDLGATESNQPSRAMPPAIGRMARAHGADFGERKAAMMPYPVRIPSAPNTAVDAPRERCNSG